MPERLQLSPEDSYSAGPSLAPSQPLVFRLLVTHLPGLIVTPPSRVKLRHSESRGAGLSHEARPAARSYSIVINFKHESRRVTRLALAVAWPGMLGISESGSHWYWRDQDPTPASVPSPGPPPSTPSHTDTWNSSCHSGSSSCHKLSRRQGPPATERTD